MGWEMFRGGSSLTDAEREALEAEARKIEQLGEAWKPSFDNLGELVLKVKEAGHDEHRRIQRDGICAAKERGVQMGRPRLEPPKDFGRFAALLDSGDLSRREAAELLGISRATLDKWRRAHEQQREQERKRTLDEKPDEPRAGRVPTLQR